jgi:hypothetical protein
VAGNASGFPTFNSIQLGMESNGYAAIEMAGGPANGTIIDFTAPGTSYKGRIYYSNVDNMFRVYANSSLTTSMVIDERGNVTAGAFFYSSDRALKKNIRPVQNSLEKIIALTGMTFNWKRDGRQDMGLIAQDVERVYPELVATDPRTGLKSVEYGNLIAPLIEAIKEQQQQINILNNKIESLEANKK